MVLRILYWEKRTEGVLGKEDTARNNSRSNELNNILNQNKGKRLVCLAKGRSSKQNAQKYGNKIDASAENDEDKLTWTDSGFSM